MAFGITQKPRSPRRADRHGLARVQANPRRTAARVAIAPVHGADCQHARRIRPAKPARRGDDPYAVVYRSAGTRHQP